MSELVRLRGKIYFTKCILCNGISHKRRQVVKREHRWWLAGRAKQCQANTNKNTNKYKYKSGQKRGHGWSFARKAKRCRALNASPPQQTLKMISNFSTFSPENEIYPEHNDTANAYQKHLCFFIFPQQITSYKTAIKVSILEWKVTLVNKLLHHTIYWHQNCFIMINEDWSEQYKCYECYI